MRVAALILALCAGVAVVDADRPGPSAVDTVFGSPLGKLVPECMVPRDLRQQNWGGGSCVHASQVPGYKWFGDYWKAVWWRKNNIGGEYSSRLARKLDAPIPYIRS